MVHVTGLWSRSDSVKTSRQTPRTTASVARDRSTAFTSSAAATGRLTGLSVGGGGGGGWDDHRRRISISPFASSSPSSSGGGRLQQQQRSRSADARGRASGGGGGGARGHDDLYVVGYAKVTTQDRPVESREGGVDYRTSVSPAGRSSRFSEYVGSRYGVTPSGGYESFRRESSVPLLRVSLRRDGPSSSLVHLPSAGEGVSYQRSSLSYGKQGIDRRVYRPSPIASSRPTSLVGSYGYTTVPLATLLGYTPSMALAREASRSSYYSRHDDISDTRRQQQQQQQQHSRSWSLPHLSTLSLPAPGISPSSTTHVITPTRIRHTWSTQELNRQRPQQPQQQQQPQQPQHYGRLRLRSQEEEEEEGDDVEEKLREIHLRALHRPIGVHPAATVYTPQTRSYDLPETPSRVEKKRVDGQRTVTAYNTRSSPTGFIDDHDYDDYDIRGRGRRWDIGEQTTKRMPRYQPPSPPPTPSLPSPSSVYESIELRPIREARKQDPLPRSLEREKKGIEGSTAVTAAPQFTSRLRPRSIVEGNAVRLSCAVSAAPEASVTWYHGDNTIANGGRYHVSYYYGLISLEINPVNRKDAGIYTVKVANPKGSVTCSAKLDVDVLPVGYRESDRPTFVTDIQSVNIDIGDKAIFKAQIIGSPRPTVAWQKDGLDLHCNDTTQIFQDDQGFYRLQIKDVKPEDSGLYSCVARNDNGMSKSIANLRVRGAPSHEFVEYESARHFATQLHEISSKEKTRPTFVAHPPAHVEVHDGDSLTLRCTVNGHPKPKVTWFKGVRELTYSQRHRFLIDKDGSFVFQIPSTMIQTDAGDYTVQAMNSIGTTKYNVVVNILPRRPDFEYQTPIPEYDLEYVTHTGLRGEFARVAEPEGPARRPVPAEVKQVEAEVSASALEISTIKPTVTEAEERVKVTVLEDLVTKPVTEIKVEEEKEVEPVLEKPAPIVEIKVVKEVEKPVEKLEEIVPEESKPAPVVEVKAGKEEKPVEHQVEEIKQEPTPVVEVKIEKSVVRAEEEEEVKVEVKKKPVEVLEEKPAPVVTAEVERERPKVAEDVTVVKVLAETVEAKHEERVTEAVEVKETKVVEENVQAVKEQKQDVVTVDEEEKQEVETVSVTKVNTLNTHAAVETVTEAKEEVTAVTKAAAGIGEKVKITKQEEVKEEAKKEVKQEVVKEEAKEEVKQEVVIEEAKKEVKQEVVKEEAKEEVKQEVVKEEAKEEVKQEVVIEEAKEEVKEVKQEVVKTEIKEVKIEAKEEEEEISKVKVKATEEKTTVVKQETEEEKEEEEEESSSEEESSEEEEEKNEEEKVIVKGVVATAAEDKVDAAVEKKVEVKEEKKVEVVEVKTEISEKVEAKEEVKSKKEERVEVVETEVKEQVITKDEKITEAEARIGKQVEAEVEKVAVVKQVEAEERMAEEVVTAKVEALEEEATVEETVKVVEKVKRGEEKEETVKVQVDVSKEETLKKPKAKDESESEEESEEEEEEEEEEGKSKVTVKKTVTTTAAVVLGTTEETTEADESSANAVVTKVIKKRTGAPSFDQPLKSELVDLGGTLTLECVVSGEPLPNVEWLKGDVVLLSAGRLLITAVEGKFTLVIRSIELTDAGKYTVRAFNEAGETRFTATVVVKGIAPSFDKPLESRLATIGAGVALECAVSGQPQPNVEWLKDGVVITGSDRVKIISEGGKHSLIIREVENSDGGKYTVRAFNDFGESRFTATVLTKEEGEEGDVVISKTVTKTKTLVSDGLAVEGAAPAFKQPLKSEVARVGGTVALCCIVTGQPQPNVEWSKDGKVLSSTKRIRMSDEDGGRYSLSISDVESSDGGKYTVRAFNDFGESRFTATLLVREQEDEGEIVVTKTVKRGKAFVQEVEGGDEGEGGGDVTITSKTVKKVETVSSSTASTEGTAPVFDEALKSQLAYVGESLTLGCSVSAEPKPNIEWLKDGAVITESSRIKMTSTDGGKFSLVISKVENSDGGKYTVRAFNSFGESRFTATVLVQGGDDGQESESKTIRKTTTVVTSQSTDDDFDGEGGVTIVKKRVSKTKTSSVTEGSDEGHGATKVISETVTQSSSGAGSGPSFDQPLNSAAVQLGETALFQCVVSGEPQPSIEWLKDGTVLTSTGRIKIASDAGGRFSLSITNVEISDGGKYAVRAFNSFGESRFTASLLVLEDREDTVITTSVKKSKTVVTSDSSRTGSAPSFEQPLKSAVAHFGETVSLECIVAGEPQPSIEWQKDGVVISTSGRVAITSGGRGDGGVIHSLSISKVESSDAGKYTVRAFNDFGESRFTATVLVKEDQQSETTTTTTITKTEKSVASSSASEVPKFVSFLKSQLSKIGGTAVLSCRVSCPTPVEVTWLKGGKKVSDGGKFSFSSSAEGGEYHLTIKDAQESDGGEYTVQVANNRAKLSCTASLLVTDEDVQLVEEEVVESEEEEASESEEGSDEDASEPE